MTKRILEITITTLLIGLTLYGLFMLMGNRIDHCRAVNSNYEDYRFCLGI